MISHYNKQKTQDVWRKAGSISVTCWMLTQNPFLVSQEKLWVHKQIGSQNSICIFTSDTACEIVFVFRCGRKLPQPRYRCHWTTLNSSQVVYSKQMRHLEFCLHHHGDLLWPRLNMLTQNYSASLVELIIKSHLESMDDYVNGSVGFVRFH